MDFPEISVTRLNVEDITYTLDSVSGFLKFQSPPFHLKYNFPLLHPNQPYKTTAAIELFSLECRNLVFTLLRYVSWLKKILAPLFIQQVENLKPIVTR